MAFRPRPVDLDWDGRPALVSSLRRRVRRYAWSFLAWTASFAFGLAQLDRRVLVMGALLLAANAWGLGRTQGQLRERRVDQVIFPDADPGQRLSGSTRHDTN